MLDRADALDLQSHDISVLVTASTGLHLFDTMQALATRKFWKWNRQRGTLGALLFSIIGQGSWRQRLPVSDDGYRMAFSEEVFDGMVQQAFEELPTEYREACKDLSIRTEALASPELMSACILPTPTSCWACTTG